MIPLSIIRPADICRQNSVGWSKLRIGVDPAWRHWRGQKIAKIISDCAAVGECRIRNIPRIVLRRIVVVFCVGRLRVQCQIVVQVELKVDLKHVILGAEDRVIACSDLAQVLGLYDTLIRIEAKGDDVDGIEVLIHANGRTRPKESNRPERSAIRRAIGGVAIQRARQTALAQLVLVIGVVMVADPTWVGPGSVVQSCLPVRER